MSAPQPSPKNPFWNFSLGIYRSPQVQQACLELQDGSGVDVNIMLFMLHLASCGRQLSAGDVSRVLAAIDPWKASVVVPLRTARRALKEPPSQFDATSTDALRKVIKKAELEAERLQQEALYHAFGPDTWPQAAPVPPQLAAKANLGSYGQALGRELAQAPVGVMLSAFDSMVTKGSVV